LFRPTSSAGAILAGVAYSVIFAHAYAPQVKGVDEHSVGTIARGA
jgi:hypothetical protein